MPNVALIRAGLVLLFTSHKLGFNEVYDPNVTVDGVGMNLGYPCNGPPAALFYIENGYDVVDPK